VLLERAALTQAGSRYELSAEYVLPPGLEIPGSFAPTPPPPPAAVASTTAPPGARDGIAGAPAIGEGGASGGGVAGAEEEEGRWRVMLSVPGARIEELLPAGQLLQQATRRAAALDPFAAKRRFLQGLSDAVAAASQEFRVQVGRAGRGSLAQAR
jgi:hypothetical protein